MQINLHQTHHEIGDFEAIFKYITNSFQPGKHQGLHFFPELFLAGYPLQDLVLQKTFIEEYQAFLNDLSNWSIKQFKKHKSFNTALLLGGLHYQFDSRGAPSQIENVIYLLEPGKKLEPIYAKQLLPNYDLYEEKKYFTPGSTPALFQFEGCIIGLLICEDMWFSHLHEIDPVEQLKHHLEKLNLKCHLVVNLSASPYHLGKHEQRVNRAIEISQYINAPLAYINKVGAEDEILFDGRSFIVDGSALLVEGKLFEEDILRLELPQYLAPSRPAQLKTLNVDTNSWSNIFQIDSLKIR